MKSNRKIYTIETPAAEGNTFDWTRFKNKLIMSKKIISKKQYDSAMTEIDELFDIDKDHPKFKRLQELAELVDKYEEINFPIEEGIVTSPNGTIFHVEPPELN